MKMLHIGIDLDNTIINYHTLFYSCARKLNLITAQHPNDKESIKKTVLIDPHKDQEWIKLQNTVYIDSIQKAKIADGFSHFLQICKKKSIQISIVSHKSKYPLNGHKIDQRKIVLSWLNKKNIVNGFIKKSDVYFTSSKIEKIKLVQSLHCTHFIDDLPEILSHGNFPKKVVKILYQPDNLGFLNNEIVTCTHWNKIIGYLFGMP